MHREGAAECLRDLPLRPKHLMPTTSSSPSAGLLRNDISNESFAGASLTVTDPYGRIQYESVGGGFLWW